jgi:hypothetical protein
MTVPTASQTRRRNLIAIVPPMKPQVPRAWRSLAVAVCLLAVVVALAPRLRSAAEAADPAAKPKIDPVVANGEIFKDWPKPSLALVFSGELDGYLEPCGCAGLENQMGGLKRRHALLKQLADQGWPLVLMDLGGLTKRTGHQTEIKYRYALESYTEMGYQAVALGANELKLSTDELVHALINIDPAKSPIVSANVGIYGFEGAEGLGSARYRVITQGGKRIGVTSVLGARHEAIVKNNADVAYLAPAAALAEIAPKLAAEKCDIQVLLVHGDPTEAATLARQFPQFQIVATAGGAEEPPRTLKPIAGTNAVLVECGHKGMYVSVIAFFDDADATKRNRFQRVPLDARFPESPEMQAKLVAYQRELETTTLSGLGLVPVAHPDGEFAGSESCASCHTAAWEVFENTPHSHATDTLVKLDPPRQFDPECLSCHVTGWNPQEYFPYASGYLGLDVTPLLKQNGCENCHGPAAAHVAAENGDIEATDAERKELAAALHLAIVPNEGNKDGQEFAGGTVVKNCMLCHDLDNSPDFDFQAYWPQVKHEGLD